MTQSSPDNSPDKLSATGETPRRRSFLQHAANGVMATGLVAGYGMFGWLSGRFLYPRGSASTGWQFVCTLDALKVGESRDYRAPSGVKVVVARQGADDDAGSFIALSSVCPHLGCQVHWESQNDRFFCPCHNGAFDASGNPTEGPPASAGQPLTRFPLKVEKGLLYVEVPLESVTSNSKREGRA